MKSSSAGFNGRARIHHSEQQIRGLVSLGGTGRDDISMQFASRDFRPCWIYTWVSVKLPLASPPRIFYPQISSHDLD